MAGPQLPGRAEQFILGRAAAVVVHTPVLQAACVERGAPAESVFCVPDPMPTAATVAEGEDYPRLSEGEFIVFAPDCAPSAQDGKDEALPWLAGFELVRRQYKDARLVLARDEFMTGSMISAASIEAEIEAEIARLKLADCITLLSGQTSGECARVMQAADVVIAGAYTANTSHLSSAHRDNLPSSTCLSAMAAGRALLAADSPQNRNVSPDGRGLLWYSADSPRDLGHRLLYLARNRDLCRSLGAAAREFILETRSTTAVGRQYDAVYRHASQKRRDRQPPAPNRLALDPAFGE